MGRLEPIVPGTLTIGEALGFAWSLPVTSVVLGVDSVAQLDENCALARREPAMDADQRRGLIERVAGFAGREREYYKS